MAPGQENVHFKYHGKAPKLNKAQMEFMRLIEEQNSDRVAKLKQLRRTNLITAGVLGVTVLGIYAYSILSVKQEKFLDDFEEPKKVSSTTN